MKRFATLFDELDQTTKTNSKINALANYFEEADDQDKVWTIALLSHRRPKRAVQTNYLKEWCAELAGIPYWLFEETYHVVGDLAETITLLIPTSEDIEKPLSDWINGLISIQRLDENTKKSFITDAWNSLNGTPLFLFNKIITGAFRVGVSQKIMVKGLAKATGIEQDLLSFKLTGKWDPASISFEDLVKSEDGENISKPYPFYLAYALDQELDEIGNPKEWQVEYKWDGIRGQLVKRSSELFVWSRGEELVTEKFPEFEVIREAIPDGTVIDGEIVAWKEGRVLPFNDLQTRIGRKNVSKNILSKTPVCLIAYDLLEHEGKDFRKETLEERRSHLEKLVDNVNHSTFKISEKVDFDSWENLGQIREDSRSLGAEGLMLKKLASSYQVGRKRGDWWKWKVDPYTIDAVLTYAMRGHGRRANLYTDYTFGLWHEGELVTFAKAYSGLTDDELREVDNYVKRNTLERFGPVRMVEPKLVFELAFEGISESTRHKSGVAVRFPRIHRWRKDKNASEANSLEDLKKLINQ